MKLKVPRVIKDWELASFVTASTSNFIANSYGRRYSKQKTAKFWGDAFECFGLKPAQVEPIFQNFTGHHYLDGAFTHEHTDVSPKGYDHVRCNLLIKKPVIGGNPVIDNEEINIDVNDLWICIASRESHKSLPIKDGERIIFSFGGLVEKSQIDRIIA
jgi:hypothetical protein